MSRNASTRPRRRAGQAKRPGRPVRQRLRGRPAAAGRILALLVFTTLVGGLVTILNGPWLRVAGVAAAGAHFTSPQQLDQLLAPYDGESLLTLDSGALAASLRALPAVAEARVSARLPDRLTVTLTEKAAALTWLTPQRRLVVAGDGSIIAELPPDAEPSDELLALPAVDDGRPASRVLAAGGSIPAQEIRAAQRLLTLDPALLGSRATGFSLRVDGEYGFILVATRPAWQVALGFYQLDPDETEAAAVARLDAQVAAVRTLFGEQREGAIGWVDARNPGKVYWAR